MLSLDLQPTELERAELLGKRALAQESARTELLSKRVEELEVKLVQLTPLSGRGGWYNVVREPYAGAWQRNDELATDTALGFSAVFSCTTLIMGDVGKLTLRLVEQDENGIWSEVENSAYSPLLRKPNRYQNRTQFIENWIASKLNTGNMYALKARDMRGMVKALYVLDPSRVTPLVAPDGSVYYQLRRDDLSGLPEESVTVPASEIIHDRMNCLFHPLIGLSPIFACALAASQGLSIQNNSSKLFSNGAVPSGVLTAPGEITPEAAARLSAAWAENYGGDNYGKVAVLGNDLKYSPMSYNAVDMQLIEQLRWTGETVCTCYHVPPYMVDIGPTPPYANADPVLQKYYSQCLQSLINALEMCLDEGIGLGRDFGNRYGTELDPDDLIWLNAESKNKAAQDGIGSGGMSPNEARKRYYSLGPVDGGETPYMQEQNWPLALLANRELPTRPPTAPEPIPAAAEDDMGDDVKLLALVRRKRAA